MRNLTLIGIILVAAGAIALAYDGFHYTQREQVLKLGSLTAEADVKHQVQVSRPAAGVAIAIGAACLLAGMNRSKSVL